MNSRSTLPIRVEKIFRHPIKSMSREEITQIKLERRKGLPLDRMWALVHEKALLTNYQMSGNRVLSFSEAQLCRRYQPSSQ